VEIEELRRIPAELDTVNAFIELECIPAEAFPEKSRTRYERQDLAR